MPIPSSPESLYLEAARRSLSSSSSSTAHHDSFSECTFQVEEDNKYAEFTVNEPKALPSSYSYDFDPYVIDHPATHPFQAPIPSLTTISQLAYALGPDNVPHTTEIDTVPCAGIRISHGALAGLLAWRLVVRPSTKEKGGWWNDNTDRGNSYPVPVPVRSYTRPLTISNPSASMSALSFPPSQSSSPDAESPYEKPRPCSVILSRQPHASKPKRRPQTIDHSHLKLNQTPSLPSALAVNFILDTTLPYSIISRDTLIALGYPSRLIPPPPPISTHPANMPSAMITLSVQNISTRFQIARPNEASRLGVQFLHDAGVSVFFPKDGDGVGPVLYVESAYMLKDVPRTILLHKIGIKLTLPQRVRALFGLS